MVLLKILSVLILGSYLYGLVTRKNHGIEGVELKLGEFQGGLWYDSINQSYSNLGWGIKLALRWGPWTCPIPKFWKWDKEHRWGDNTWFTLRGPFIIFPFISVSLGKWGAYFGAKDNRHDDPNILIISATARKDRTK